MYILVDGTEIICNKCSKTIEGLKKIAKEDYFKLTDRKFDNNIDLTIKVVDLTLWIFEAKVEVETEAEIGYWGTYDIVELIEQK